MYLAIPEMKFLFQKFKIYELLISNELEKAKNYFYVNFRKILYSNAPLTKSNEKTNNSFNQISKHFELLFDNFPLCQMILFEYYSEMKNCLIDKFIVVFMEIFDSNEYFVVKRNLNYSNPLENFTDFECDFYKQHYNDTTYSEVIYDKFLECEIKLVKLVEERVRSNRLKKDSLYMFEDAAGQLQYNNNDFNILNFCNTNGNEKEVFSSNIEDCPGYKKNNSNSYINVNNNYNISSNYSKLSKSNSLLSCKGNSNLLNYLNYISINKDSFESNNIEHMKVINKMLNKEKLKSNSINMQDKNNNNSNNSYIVSNKDELENENTLITTEQLDSNGLIKNENNNDNNSNNNSNDNNANNKGLVQKMSTKHKNITQVNSYYSYKNGSKINYYFGIPTSKIPILRRDWVSFIILGNNAKSFFMMSYYGNRFNLITNSIINNLDVFRINAQNRNYSTYNRNNSFLKEFMPRFMKKESIDKMILRKFKKYLKKLLGNYTSDDIKNMKINFKSNNKINSSRCNLISNNKSNNINDNISNYRNINDSNITNINSLVEYIGINNKTNDCDSKEATDIYTYSSFLSFEFLFEFINNNYLPPFKNNKYCFKSFSTQYLLWLFNNEIICIFYKDFISEFSSSIYDFFLQEYDLVNKENSICDKLKYYINNLSELYDSNSKNNSVSGNLSINNMKVDYKYIYDLILRIKSKNKADKSCNSDKSIKTNENLSTSKTVISDNYIGNEIMNNCKNEENNIFETKITSNLLTAQIDDNYNNNSNFEDVDSSDYFEKYLMNDK